MKTLEAQVQGVSPSVAAEASELQGFPSTFSENKELEEIDKYCFVDCNFQKKNVA